MQLRHVSRIKNSRRVTQPISTRVLRPPRDPASRKKIYVRASALWVFIQHVAMTTTGWQVSIRRREPVIVEEASAQANPRRVIFLLRARDPITEMHKHQGGERCK